MNPHLCGCEIESMHSMCVCVSRFFFITVSAQTVQRLMLTTVCVPAKMHTRTRSHQLMYTDLNTQTVLRDALRASYDPSEKKKSIKAVTQMEKSWQVKKSRGQDGSWSRYRGEKIWSELFSSSLTFHLVWFAIVSVSTGVTWLDIYSRLCVMRGRGFPAGVWGFDWML